MEIYLLIYLHILSLVWLETGRAFCYEAMLVRPVDVQRGSSGLVDVGYEPVAPAILGQGPEGLDKR